MAKRRATKKTARLPSGKYAWRGRAVPFSRLPKAQQHAWRAHRAMKAAATRARTRAEPTATGHTPKSWRKFLDSLRVEQKKARAEYRRSSDRKPGQEYQALVDWFESEYETEVPEKWWFYH